MARKISKKKKFLRVIKRKLLKPVLYAVGMSLIIYMVIGNVVTRKEALERQSPHFVITKLSEEFDETEFMYMLLVTQELMKKDSVIAEKLGNFINESYPAPAPRPVKAELYRLNWDANAYLIRMKKLFRMYETYERLGRLDDTIAFLKAELEENRLPAAIGDQLQLLEAQRDEMKKNEMTAAEYAFMEEYAGVVQRLMH